MLTGMMTMAQMLTTSEEVHVGISEYKIAAAPAKLVTVGLGSCVGTIIYDRQNQIGGLSHIMLPDSQPFAHRQAVKIEKFADLALPAMVAELRQLQPDARLRAKIVGGANMFSFKHGHETESIGARNIAAVEGILAQLGIPIVGKHVGGSAGRTMIVDLRDFQTVVRQANKEIVYV